MKPFLKSIAGRPESWVRLAQASWARRGRLMLHFDLANGRGGPILEEWWVSADRVKEYSLSDATGGGLPLTRGSHPAVRQYTDSQMALRFRGGVDDAAAGVGGRWGRHVQAVDDWIPSDRYLPSPGVLEELLSKPAGRLCRGPAFLLRHYAACLRTRGMRTTLVPCGSSRSVQGPLGLLHF